MLAQVQSLVMFFVAGADSCPSRSKPLFFTFHMSRSLEHHVAEIASILVMPKQIRLPGLISKITGLERSTVSRHLAQHLGTSVANPYIRQVCNRGGEEQSGRARATSLPADLPESEGEDAEASLMQPLEEWFPRHSAPLWDENSELHQPLQPCMQNHGLKFCLSLGCVNLRFCDGLIFGCC